MYVALLHNILNDSLGFRWGVLPRDAGAYYLLGHQDRHHWRVASWGLRWLPLRKKNRFWWWGWKVPLFFGGGKNPGKKTMVGFFEFHYQCFRVFPPFLVIFFKMGLEKNLGETKRKELEYPPPPPNHPSWRRSDSFFPSKRNTAFSHRNS